MKPRSIFLLDCIGALTSAVFLGYLLVKFSSYIGLPIQALYLLASLALVFALYSLVCYLLFPKNWQTLLKLIAAINTTYCLLTIALCIHYFPELTILGLAYFVLEIGIIGWLVRLEFLVAGQNG